MTFRACLAQNPKMKWAFDAPNWANERTALPLLERTVVVLVATRPKTFFAFTNVAD